MASPQKENGYTAIANEIVEHLCFAGITGSEYRILLFVLRKTYGFQKKKDRISFTQFQKGTGMNRAHAIRTINSLVHKGILVKDNNSYSFNKNWEDWVVHKRVPSTQSDTTASTRLDTKGSTQSGTYKRKKETITKETPAQSAGNTTNAFISLFKEINPSYEQLFKRPPQRAAADRLLKLHDFDWWQRFMPAYATALEDRYCPRATTPMKMEDKIGDIEHYGRSKKAEKISKGNNFII